MSDNGTEPRPTRAPFSDHLWPISVTTQKICATLVCVLRAAGFLFLWVGGIVAAVAVAWAGVSAVDDDLVDPAPAAGLEDAEISLTPAIVIGAAPAADSSQLGDADPADDATPAGVTSQLASDAESGPTEDAGADSGSPAQASGTDEPTPSTTPSPTTAVTTPTTNEPPTQTTVPQTTAPVTTTPSTSPTIAPTTTAAPSQTLTFNLDGGSAAITFASTGATLSWASPNPGFEMSIETDEGETSVRFRSDNHESRVDGWWLDGPKFRIRERPASGGGGGDGDDSDDD